MSPADHIDLCFKIKYSVPGLCTFVLFINPRLVFESPMNQPPKDVTSYFNYLICGFQPSLMVTRIAVPLSI